MNAERARRRALIAFEIVRTIQQRSGAQAVDHLHLSAITAIADTRGLWLFLLEKGLATEAQHQDYLDKGYDQLREQVQGKASEIYVEGAAGRG